eukprot:3187381-Amphidinium_carterae.1
MVPGTATPPGFGGATSPALGCDRAPFPPPMGVGPMPHMTGGWPGPAMGADLSWSKPCHLQRCVFLHCSACFLSRLKPTLTSETATSDCQSSLGKSNDIA